MQLFWLRFLFFIFLAYKKDLFSEDDLWHNLQSKEKYSKTKLKANWDEIEDVVLLNVLNLCLKFI